MYQAPAALSVLNAGPLALPCTCEPVGKQGDVRCRIFFLVLSVASAKVIDDELLLARVEGI
jgi:hypothetical protein